MDNSESNTAEEAIPVPPSTDVNGAGSDAAPATNDDFATGATATLPALANTGGPPPWLGSREGFAQFGVNYLAGDLPTGAVLSGPLVGGDDSGSERGLVGAASRTARLFAFDPWLNPWLGEKTSLASSGGMNGLAGPAGLGNAPMAGNLASGISSEGSSMPSRNVPPAGTDLAIAAPEANASGNGSGEENGSQNRFPSDLRVQASQVQSSLVKAGPTQNFPASNVAAGASSVHVDTNATPAVASSPPAAAQDQAGAKPADGSLAGDNRRPYDVDEKGIMFIPGQEVEGMKAAAQDGLFPSLTQDDLIAAAERDSAYQVTIQTMLGKKAYGEGPNGEFNRLPGISRVDTLTALVQDGKIPNPPPEKWQRAKQLDAEEAASQLDDIQFPKAEYPGGWKPTAIEPSSPPASPQRPGQASQPAPPLQATPSTLTPPQPTQAPPQPTPQPQAGRLPQSGLPSQAAQLPQAKQPPQPTQPPQPRLSSQNEQPPSSAPPQNEQPPQAVPAPPTAPAPYPLVNGEAAPFNSWRPLDALTAAANDGVIEIPPQEIWSLAARNQQTLKAAGLDLPDAPPTPAQLAQARVDVRRGRRAYGLDALGRPVWKDGAWVRGMTEAARDGILSPVEAAAYLPHAKVADAKFQELVEAAGSHPELKAFIASAVRSAISTEAAAAVTRASDVALGLGGGAVTLETGGWGALVLPLIARGTIFLGAQSATNWALKAVQSKLAQYSDTVRQFEASEQLAPRAALWGDLSGGGVRGILSLKNIARLGESEFSAVLEKGLASGLDEATATAQARLAATKIISTRLVSGAASGAAFELTLRPAFDALRNAGADALGVDHAQLQNPTVQSVLNSAFMGMIFSGDGKASTPETLRARSLLEASLQARADGIPIEQRLSPADLRDYQRLAPQFAGMLNRATQQLSLHPEEFRNQINSMLSGPGRSTELDSGGARVGLGLTDLPTNSDINPNIPAGIPGGSGGRARRTSSLQKADKTSSAPPASVESTGKTLYFQDFEVQGVHDLSHLSIEDLKDMKRDGTSAMTINGERIVTHHIDQKAAGPILEVPEPRHSVWNKEQHPFGNKRGVGLTDEERAAHNAWRVRYWKWRATEELERRQKLGQ